MTKRILTETEIAALVAKALVRYESEMRKAGR